MAKKTKAELVKQADERSDILLGFAEKGWHRQKLLEYSLLEFGVAPRTAERYIAKAYDKAKLKAGREKEHAFAMHLGRYERIFKESMKKFEALPKNEEGGFDVDWKMKANLQLTMLQALKYREDLIGLHDKNLNIQVNNNKATIYDEKKKQSSTAFDINKLTLEEKIELRDLIMESRLEEVEGIYPVIKVDPSKYQDTIDADFTVVEKNEDDSLPENVVVKMINVGKKEEVKPVVKKVTIQDVKDKLKKTQNEEFLKLMKQAKQENK